ncbi:MAG: NUDIX domain-containing protein [Candidatus Thorarchaeota archaeon]
MSDLELYWRGRIPLSKVDWSLIEEEVELPAHLEAKREEIWNQTLASHPDTYDGRVLVLRELKFTSDNINLGVGYIRFSNLMTLHTLGESLDRYGSLGMQVLVFTPDKKYTLLGERSPDSLYCPLYYSSPGGMLEMIDTETSVEEAVMREVREEMKLDVRAHKHLIALVGELHGTVGVALLIELISDQNVDVDKSVVGNEEWKGRKLSWHPSEFLETIDPKQALDGVVFAKVEWEKYKAGHDSVIWKSK